ncbi:hypothetical protein J437_LFUL012195 [Ladona fulva]|uniref:Uncharacterized protein n=1 Tax=Ladona fulva TaxID=123851 RepID=A0A8K0KPM1_LADFU|nr:hypothetical protein J437_LFUL012195 [Ladona fulva]
MFDRVSSNKKRWRDYQMDSGSESQGLLSSTTSLRSKGSYGGSAVMFPDSETSDYESSMPMRISRSQQSLTSERNHHYSSRRPYHYRNDHRFKGRIDDLSSIPMTYNRFQYYNKLRTYAADEDSILSVPDHVIPENFWVPYIPGSSHAGKQNSLITIVEIVPKNV